MVPREDVLKALETVSGQLWPGVPVFGTMETGISDSIYTMRAGIPTYGITAVGVDENDVRAHGKDERLRVTSFKEGVEFFNRFVRAIDPPAQTPEQ